MRRALITFICLFGFALPAFAQDNFWVQIEARRTLASSQERASGYARRLDNVAGFFLGDGFYGIFIGPFSEQDARTTLSRLLASGAIPSDSFVKDGTRFRQQYWPLGATGNLPLAAVPGGARGTSAADAETIETRLPDETPQEARASERNLTREEREALQIAMQWAGFYNAAIDGSFGRGTRAAMQAWQTSNNHEPTGVLTTAQRAELLDQYDSVLDGLNLRTVRDDASGIQILVPTDVVAFTEYQPPFVRFDASGNIPEAKVLFISQEGDAGTLVGLYEVMQILDIVPLEGPRSRTDDSFLIEGVNDQIHSYTTVNLEDGALKGFTLVWPAGDDLRRQRVIGEMTASFQRLPGTLDPSLAPPGEDQAIDLISGLSIRKPQFSRSGFYVSSDGIVVTTIDAVGDCERITLDREVEAQVLATDASLGVAILRPNEEIAPLGVAQFLTATPRLQDQIAVAGYPFDGVLSAPTLTFGQIADIRSLNGDSRLKRLSILTQDGDRGGPIFDESGAVLGMLQSSMAGADQVLPADVQFSVDAAEIVALLTAQGIGTSAATPASAISPVALTRQAADVTALVSCW